MQSNEEIFHEAKQLVQHSHYLHILIKWHNTLKGSYTQEKLDSTTVHSCFYIHYWMGKKQVSKPRTRLDYCHGQGIDTVSISPTLLYQFVTARVYCTWTINQYLMSILSTFLFFGLSWFLGSFFFHWFLGWRRRCSYWLRSWQLFFTVCVKTWKYNIPEYRRLSVQWFSLDSPEYWYNTHTSWLSA